MTQLWSSDPYFNHEKCARQRKRLNSVYNRSPKRGAYGSCGQMVDSYEVKFDINAANYPCQAVRQLNDEMIRFSNSHFINEQACERSANQIAKVTILDVELNNLIIVSIIVYYSLRVLSAVISFRI